MKLEMINQELEVVQQYLKSEIEGIAFYLSQDRLDAEQKALRLISANREITSLVAQIEILRKTKTRLERGVRVGANDTSNR